ncbi:nuclear body protein SP140-like protein [Scomber scombrus]|uniref:nuclear body protein SP140-like protein n=1 Tax=Scomber scombrus TaxID=13677 RepID=UPI002DD84F07|nr:nuclear body protein SP140-like protein [Scomber scombrus]
MDPMDFLEADELLRFFHCNKTEMSCMENPHIFLNQLRDHNLIPEDSYKKVSRMKSKDNMKKGLYDILDWLEKERSEHIYVFWRCVFKDTIMNQYPILRELRKSLMDGSFHFYTQLPEKVEQEETDERKRKGTSEDEEGEEKQASSAKKKRKQRRRSGCDLEEEQPGPSSQLTPSHNKKSKKIIFSSPLKKGEKSDIWTWAIYKSQLPVTCGVQKGMLNKDRLAKGEKSIVVNRKWYTPTEFERLAGKKNYKNWKLSIRCSDTPLLKLIQDGHLKSVRYKGGCKKSKRSLFPSNTAITVINGEEDEDEEDRESLSERESSPDVTDEEGETEEEPQTSSGQTVFKVTCGALVGTLHKKRFASGTCGKSIRTETSWMNPEEFMREVLTEKDASWRKDVLWEGKPLSVLIEAKILKIHSLLCTCKLCSRDPNDLDNQRNDDDCCICKTEGEEKLVECDECPRSFHQECHLPHVEDTILEDDAPWVCTFCVFRRNQQWRYSSELERNAVMTHQISSHMLECQYLLLSLYSADEEQTFATNPSLYLGDYTSLIKTPMWLGNVADKLQRNHYQSVGEFVSDVELIFTNCASYNKDNAEFLAVGVRLKELFDREFKNAFSIHEDAEL